MPRGRPSAAAEPAAAGATAVDADLGFAAIGGDDGDDAKGAPAPAGADAGAAAAAADGLLPEAEDDIFARLASEVDDEPFFAEPAPAAAAVPERSAAPTAAEEDEEDILGRLAALGASVGAGLSPEAYAVARNTSLDRLRWTCSYCICYMRGMLAAQPMRVLRICLGGGSYFVNSNNSVHNTICICYIIWLILRTIALVV